MTEAAPAGHDALRLADWAETQALITGKSLGASALANLGAQHAVGTADVGLALQEMGRRAKLLKDRYPFVIANGVAARKSARFSPWTWLLLLTAGNPGRTTLPLGEAAVHLEQITAAALEDFWGPCGRAARFGWPGDAGRPPEFSGAIAWLAARMGVEVGDAYRPPARKDGGVDVVGWRPFPDGRSGFPVILVQCTVEADFAHKAGDADVRVWSGWLRLDTDPATALAVPGVVVSGETWNGIAARTMLLDRTRLAGVVNPDSLRVVPTRDWAMTAIEHLSESG